jgi:hypothetical protein
MKARIQIGAFLVGCMAACLMMAMHTIDFIQTH